MRISKLMLIVGLIGMLPTLAAAEMVVGDATADMLLIADTTTGELTDYVSVGTPHLVSLAYDFIAGRLYGTDTSEGVNQVLEIDPISGMTTMILQVPDMFIVFHSTAVDPATGQLYAIDQEHGDLYRIDVELGEMQYVGPLGVYWVTGADFDPVTGQLYACVGGLDDSGALYIIDTATGAATLVASTHRLMGLGFDVDGTLYGVNNYWYPDDPGMYRIDKYTGAWEELAQYPGRNTMSIDYVDLGLVTTEHWSLSGVKSLFE